MITDYEIRDDAGTLVAIHRRHDRPDRPKAFTWMDAGRRLGLSGMGSSASGGRAIATVTGASVLPDAERLTVL